jgi:hypothetical protein
MSRCKLRTPWPIHFKLRIVIGIDSLMVCILFGEISIFHSRVMGLHSSNCRRFFVFRSVNWEPLGQFTSNFAQLLELIVLQSVYFLVKFWFFIQELWERKSLQILYECWRQAYLFGFASNIWSCLSANITIHSIATGIVNEPRKL